MGYTFEVAVWVRQRHGGYGYDTEWTGESMIAALWNFIKIKRRARRAGIGCVTLYWR